jgi:segregation and condensation protein B
VPGRPLLDGTGKRFLEVFGLGSLKELPSLRELEELAREQGIELAGDEEAAFEDIETPDPADASEASEDPEGGTPAPESAPESRAEASAEVHE